MEQQDREKSLCMFRNGSSYILVSTDLASRGLDIPEIKNVVHYHYPTDKEAFVHRNGRTARMFAEGEAFIVMHKEDKVPPFIGDDYPEFELPKDTKLPTKPFWETVYIGKGKRDKLSKKDIAGFVMQKGGLNKESVGKIEIKEHFSFVAIESKELNNFLKKTENEKIKGIKTKLERAK